MNRNQEGKMTSHGMNKRVVADKRIIFWLR